MSFEDVFGGGSDTALLEAIKAKTDLIGTTAAIVLQRTAGSQLYLFTGEEHAQFLPTAFDYTSQDVRLVIEPQDSLTDKLVVENAEFVAKSTTGVTFTLAPTLTGQEGRYVYSIRLSADHKVLESGRITVSRAALKD